MSYVPMEMEMNKRQINTSLLDILYCLAIIAVAFVLYKSGIK